MWYTYIIRCSNSALYTGVTTDVSKRLRRHNSQRGSKYTRGRTPVILMHQESYLTKSEALKREAQIKRWSRDKKEALINGKMDNLVLLSKSRD